MPTEAILKGWVKKFVTQTAYHQFNSYFKKMLTWVQCNSYLKKSPWVIPPAILLNTFMLESDLGERCDSKFPSFSLCSYVSFKCHIMRIVILIFKDMHFYMSQTLKESQLLHLVFNWITVVWSHCRGKNRSCVLTETEHRPPVGSLKNFSRENLTIYSNWIWERIIL